MLPAKQPGAAHPLDLLVRKLSLSVPLDEDVTAALLALPHVVRPIAPGDYVIREGERPTHSCILVSGFLFRQKIATDGGRQIIGVNVPGEAVDFQHLYLDVADHNIQALTRAEIACIPRAALQALIEAHPPVARAAIVATLVEASIFREWLLNIGRRDARARIAHLLCEFATRLEALHLTGTYGYELPMTQEQLGDALGLTPVHINRTLKGLEADGLITRTRRHIAFPDWARLREVGDFDERYLHVGVQGGQPN
ncbi:Crp/Fnr family transcriptional regulator [Sphingomonas naphthae]|uniref:Crp/Fnr family transcriptional regulator n=1 Tax=Sphingomonas naphthae TaxID=1813468 RepID=A0ABY7TMC8_9SPHN|nr:Crp/Fnr family transcriptional regulator [Sphingomonas naphthae]WCT74388.1 Crp/Fnr family transcriptional regulator [Sphingomonas naphthae]